MLAEDPCKSPRNHLCIASGWDKSTEPGTDDGVDLFIWGNAESCVTIIAASIPILRVLVRDAKTSYRSYYVSEPNDNNNTALTGSRVRGQNSVVVTGGRRDSNHAGNKLDDGSEKSILGGSTSPGKIIRKNEVVVEYQDRRDGESMEYEMGPMTS